MNGYGEDIARNSQGTGVIETRVFAGGPHSALAWFVRVGREPPTSTNSGDEPVPQLLGRL